jgi:hypothetical protein
MTEMQPLPRTAFDDARLIEHRGRQILAPWLTEVSDNGRWVWIAKNGLAETIQRAGVDIVIAMSANADLALDCKFQDGHRDVPFETWSNLRLMPGFTKQDFMDSGYSAHMIDRRASTPGWGTTSHADLILVYDIKGDWGLIGRKAAWLELLLGREPSTGQPRWQIYQWREQAKRWQPNSSWVIWTPRVALTRHARFQMFTVRQLGLWDRPATLLKLASERS